MYSIIKINIFIYTYVGVGDLDYEVEDGIVEDVNYVFALELL